MTDTNQISSVKSSPKVAGLKRMQNASSKGIEEMKGAKRVDLISFSNEAKDALELGKFVDILRNMPDVRSKALSQAFDFSSPRVLQEVARKIEETL